MQFGTVIDLFYTKILVDKTVTFCSARLSYPSLPKVSLLTDTDTAVTSSCLSKAAGKGNNLKASRLGTAASKESNHKTSCLSGAASD